MTIDQVVELSQSAITLTLLLGAPLMLVAASVGLATSLLQAITQIQDQSLSFVPKIIAVLVAGLLLLPWSMARMVEYATSVVQDIPLTL